MTARRHPFFTSARGRLLSFNLLMGVVTLLVSGVAVFGFHHASQAAGAGAAPDSQRHARQYGSGAGHGECRHGGGAPVAGGGGAGVQKAKRNGCWRRSRR